MTRPAHFPAKTCPDAHFAGITCATCEDVGRIHEGQCPCGETILMDPGLAHLCITHDRMFYPGEFDHDQDGRTSWLFRCRQCSAVALDHWRPVALTASV